MASTTRDRLSSLCADSQAFSSSMPAAIASRSSRMEIASGNTGIILNRAFARWS